MVLLLHEQRYSAYSLLSCHIFCLFDSTFLYLKVCFTLILNTLMETPLTMTTVAEIRAMEVTFLY